MFLLNPIFNKSKKEFDRKFKIDFLGCIQKTLALKGRSQTHKPRFELLIVFSTIKSLICMPVTIHAPNSTSLNC